MTARPLAFWRWRLPLFLAVAVLVFLIAPRESAFDGPLHLAERLLAGKAYFDERVSYWEMFEREGRFYLVYAPLASALLVPYVALGGSSLGLPAANALLLLLAAVLLWRLLRGIKSLRPWAEAGAAAYLLGTPLLYAIAKGDVWLLVHSEGNLFLLAALLALQRRRFAWLGFFLALALACRHALAFGAPVLLLALARGRPDRRFLKRLAAVAAGALLPAALHFGLTAAMTGSPFASTYSLGYREWKTPPLYTPEHLLPNLRFYFTALPGWSPRPPYLVFDPAGQAFWSVSPFFLLLLVLRLRRRVFRYFLLAALATFIPYLFFLWNGYAQYGSRYVSDLFPYLVPLAFTGASRLTGRPGKGLVLLLIALSMAINAVAVWRLKTGTLGF